MFKRYFPILGWAKKYNREKLTHDLVAALIVTIMLIPQSLAYALLAGLPAEVGLYASIAPLVLYTIFGTSTSLAVGPVAVASLMTAAAAGNLAAQGTAEYLGAAIALAFISGLMLTVMGLLRLGFLSSFLSHPVISGFITAAGILIAASQVRHILGIQASGHGLIELVGAIFANLSGAVTQTIVIGVLAIGFLFWVRKYLKPTLRKLGLSPFLADLISKTGPVAAVAATTLAVWAMNLQSEGVAIVGDIPRGLPRPALPPLDMGLWMEILAPALLISIVGYVETISVAQTLAAKRRERIDPDQELIALGAANIGSAVSGGFPVTGGFARSVVNFDAGAATQAAGFFTALGMGFATIFLTPLLYFLPKATLAATIIVAVLSLVDFRSLVRNFRYAKSDFAAQLGTILATLIFGVEVGIMSGVGISVLLHLYRTSHPHIAEIGQVPGTEHFRNVNRHKVITFPEVLSIRVDESLYFPNARFIEDTVFHAVAKDERIKHVVLNCAAVNFIDASALEALESINSQLDHHGIKLHLAEVKGPVTDRLSRTHFLEELTGGIHLTQYHAMYSIEPELTALTALGQPFEPMETGPRT